MTVDDFLKGDFIGEVSEVCIYVGIANTVEPPTVLRMTTLAKPRTTRMMTMTALSLPLTILKVCRINSIAFP